MFITNATFEGSSTTLAGCPHPQKPCFAFIGRSNVGKSSLINGLLKRKKLAKTSSTPGKTQLINYFLVNERWCLVDLPGYGWARVSKTKRIAWQSMIRGYLSKNKALVTTLLLVDSRHLPQALDIAFVDWLGRQSLACAVVFTKADKCKDRQLHNNVKAFQAAMQTNWESLPPFFITSALKPNTRDSLLAYLAKCLEKVHANPPKSV